MLVCTWLHAYPFLFLMAHGTAPFACFACSAWDQVQVLQCVVWIVSCAGSMMVGSGHIYHMLEVPYESAVPLGPRLAAPVTMAVQRMQRNACFGQEPERCATFSQVEAAGCMHGCSAQPGVNVEEKSKGQTASGQGRTINVSPGVLAVAVMEDEYCMRTGLWHEAHGVQALSPAI